MFFKIELQVLLSNGLSIDTLHSTHSHKESVIDIKRPMMRWKQLVEWNHALIMFYNKSETLKSSSGICYICYIQIINYFLILLLTDAMFCN